jgi:hypothetical protein
MALTRIEPPAVTDRTQVRRGLTFRSLLRGGVDAVLGVNSRWLRTTRDLFVNAGRTAAEYVREARDYSHPVAYALACITVYVVAREFTTPPDSFVSMFDPVIALSAWWAYLSVPLLAPAAFVLRRLFRRRESSAAESYVLVLYVAAQIALMEAAWTLLLHAGVPGEAGWAVRLLEGLYAMTAVVQFTGERRWHGWVRSALVLGSALAVFAGAMWFYAWQVASIFR